MSKKQKNASRDYLDMAWQLGDWKALASFNNAHADTSSSLLVWLARLHLEANAAEIESTPFDSDKLSKNDAHYLLSSIHDTLGKAFFIKEDVESAMAHFEEAAELALGDINVPAAKHTRIQSQLCSVKLYDIVTSPSALSLSFDVDDIESTEPREIITSHYHWDEDTEVWSPDSEAAPQIEPSHDEQRLAQCVEDLSDRSLFSRELFACQTDWVSEYHLSPDRANLLRPFSKVFTGSSVLELGSGCGAITRYLGETATSVVAVEEKYHQAVVAAKRTADLQGVSVIHDGLDALPFEQLFDVVLIVGALEHAREHVHADDPVQYLLESARRYLKPGGVLLLAIQNQLGLKYFAGAEEDNAMGVMAGIQDLYSELTPVTFGRGEMERRLLQAGFESVESHLPFPNYKLPCVVVHPTGYQRSHLWQLDTLLSTTVSYDTQGISDPTFSLEAAWPVICRNNMTQDMTNSYLFAAFNGSQRHLVSEQQLASYFSPKRTREAQQELVFFLDSKNVIKIQRSQYDASSGKLVSDIESYIKGQTHAQLLDKILQRPGWTLDAMRSWLQIWVDELLKHQVEPQNMPSEWPDYKVYLPANFLDAIPRNVMLSDSGYIELIDLEWSVEHTCPLSLVLYRGLLVTLSSITSVCAPETIEFVDRNILLDRLLLEVGIELTIDDKLLFAGVMRELEVKALGKDSTQSLSSIPVMSPFRVRSGLNQPSTKYNIQCFWRYKDNGFSEENTSTALAEADGQPHEYVLALRADDILSELRFDISESEGLYIIHQMRIENADNEVVWELNIASPQLTSSFELEYYASKNKDVLNCISKGNDPQMLLDLSPSTLEAIGSRGSIIITLQSYI